MPEFFMGWGVVGRVARGPVPCEPAFD